MKKLFAVICLALLICSLFAFNVLATDAPEQTPCAGCPVCNPKEEASIDEMKEMEIGINSETVEAFVDSLGYMGKGLVGIFVVTLVIVGVVAILNWHGRSLEKRNQNKKDN